MNVTMTMDIARRTPLLLLLAVTLATAQNPSSEHVFQVSRADLETALATLRVNTPGRLPILDGFVAPEVTALDKYQRAYYQYKLEIRPAGAASTALRVSVKVTAWYAGDNSSPAGYRVLPSNGRLESDLLERLEDALQQKSATVAAGTPLQATAPSPATENKSSAATRPTPPAKPSTFGLTFPIEPASRAGLEPPNSRQLAQEKRFQQLTEQATNLEEVLHNQAHPNDLAAVLKTGTPIFAKPIDPGEVLFRADAEDEFKVLDQSGDWVHVQVSGISRGWIRRKDLEMPGESEHAAEVKPATPPEPQTHEETSLFPGEWPALRGHIVRIAWVRPGSGAAMGRWELARSMFRATYDNVTRGNMKVDGVVLIIDAADGGMVAATTDALHRWNTGALSDAAFRKECWTDSPEALGETAHRESGVKSQSQ